MFGVQMSRRIGVDVDQLRDGAKALKGAVAGHRPSTDGSDGFGSTTALGAVHRFEGYWVPGQSAVDELVAGLADALDQAAGAYERRETADASTFRVDGGEFVGF